MTVFRFIFFIIVLAGFVSARPLIDLKGFDELSWQMQPFELTRPTRLEIDVLGNFSRGEWQAKGWILDVTNDKIVWEMRRSKVDEISSEGQCRLNQIFELPAGEYEVHFGTQSFFRRYDHSFLSFLNDLFGDRDASDNLLRQWHLFLEPVESDRSQMVLVKAWRSADTIIDLSGAGDSEMLEDDFRVAKETTIEVFMIGEGRRSSQTFYDYGWILDLDTRERLWQAEIRDSQHAGGAKKNRIIHKRLVLKPGNYRAVFITDDSHSLDGFNAMPPYDASRWGLLIRGDNSVLDKHVDPESLPEPVVDLTQVENEEWVSRGFELQKSMDLRVYAMGEMGYSKELVDKGWIIDAYTHRPVWKMSRRNTFHAGGAKKNMMADEIITLPKGAYIAYYKSDDSHAFGDWNSAPPFQEKAWGLTLYALYPQDRRYVQDYDIDDDPNFLVSLIRIGDDQKHEKTFGLQNDATISIYAMGEGDRDEMCDYGWIEDQRGQIVWKMSYGKTIHAGGAKKNRKFSGTIDLPAGPYWVYYQTDDSHSFDDWNTAPPDDPFFYGITIARR